MKKTNLPATSILALLLCSGVYADTVNANIAVDDAFDAYISTNPSQQGDLFVTGTNWSTTYTGTAGLTPGVVNYLQVKGRDVYGNPQMFIGQFSLEGSGFRFENNTQDLLTSPTHWVMTRDGFGGTPEAIRNIGPNGTSPWGLRPGISAHARFIWTDEFSSGNRYFTARIVPVTGRPVIDGQVTLQDFEGLVSGRTIELTISNGVVTETGSAVLDAVGHFNYVTNLNPGPYTVGIKASHWLRKNSFKDLVATIPNVVNVSLINGDVDADNEVNIVDFAAIGAAFASVEGDANWIAEADLNGDGEVNLVDFGIVSSRFGQAGDE